MRAASGQVQSKTALAASEERRRWDRDSKARKKRATMGADENVKGTREASHGRLLPRRAGRRAQLW